MVYICKRIKCDLNTPSCIQCSRRNFDCPGYTKAVKWSTKHELRGSNGQEIGDSGGLFSSEPTHRQWFSHQAERLHAALRSDLSSSPNHILACEESSAQGITGSLTVGNTDKNPMKFTTVDVDDDCVLCELYSSRI